MDLHMSPRRVLAEHSSYELQEWLAYYVVRGEENEKRMQEQKAKAKK